MSEAAGLVVGELRHHGRQALVDQVAIGVVAKGRGIAEPIGNAGQAAVVVIGAIDAVTTRVDEARHVASVVAAIADRLSGAVGLPYEISEGVVGEGAVAGAIR